MRGKAKASAGKKARPAQGQAKRMAAPAQANGGARGARKQRPGKRDAGEPAARRRAERGRDSRAAHAPSATLEPPAQSFELEGWRCEVLSGFGVGCVGYPQARAVTLGGVQVCFTNDSDAPAPAIPAAVRAFLLDGALP